MVVPSVQRSTKPSFRMQPVVFTWDGERRVMVPDPRFHNVCGRQYEHGEEYALELVEERSMASHRQYFAAVHEGWQNLSEENAKHFPTSEHLRKWALVQTGYCTETDFVADSEKEARKLIGYLRRLNAYSVIKLGGNVVKVFDPESQSTHAMKKARFEQSKKDVLDLIASMARTTRPQLMKHGGRSA